MPLLAGVLMTMSSERSSKPSQRALSETTVRYRTRSVTERMLGTGVRRAQRLITQMPSMIVPGHGWLVVVVLLVVDVEVVLSVVVDVEVLPVVVVDEPGGADVVVVVLASVLDGTQSSGRHHRARARVSKQTSALDPPPSAADGSAGTHNAAGPRTCSRRWLPTSDPDGPTSNPDGVVNRTAPRDG